MMSRSKNSIWGKGLNGKIYGKCFSRNYQLSLTWWCNLKFYLIVITVKPVLRGHSKIDKTKVFMANDSLMKVESIAECSPWSILQQFWPALSDKPSWKTIFGLLFEWPLKTGLTVLCMLGIFLLSADVFKTNYFQKIFQKYHPSVYL